MSAVVKSNLGLGVVADNAEVRHEEVVCNENANLQSRDICMLHTLKVVCSAQFQNQLEKFDWHSFLESRRRYSTKGIKRKSILLYD